MEKYHEKPEHEAMQYDVIPEISSPEASYFYGSACDTVDKGTEMQPVTRYGCTQNVRDVTLETFKRTA